MHLDRIDEKMLNGEYGEAKKLALKILVSIGETLGAERLIPISHAHISGVSYFNIGDDGLEFLEDMLIKGAKTTVFTTANPYSIAIHENYSKYYDSSIVEKQKRIVDILIKIGIAPNSFTCIPYKIRKPFYGEHVAWAESSAVIYGNSILGVYTNRESGISALMASIVGKTYYYGMHIDENRKAQEYIIVEEDIRTISLASILGLYVGRIARGVPFIDVNMPVENAVYKELIIRSLLASIATTSDLPLVIVKNASPITIHRDVDTRLLERVRVDMKELRVFIEEKCGNVLFLGCPHMTVNEAEFVLNTIDFKEITKLGIEKILIATPIQNYNRSSKRVEGDIEIEYIPGVCPVVSNLVEMGIDSVATIHGKAHHYLPKLSGVKSCILNIV